MFEMCLFGMRRKFIYIFLGFFSAYKTYAGRDGTFPLKLQADFRPKRGKVAVNGFARFSLNPACQCDVLKQTGKACIHSTETG